jgi:hypothetical protein
VWRDDLDIRGHGRRRGVQHPALLVARQSGLTEAGVANVIAASAEGYASPTNLDRDQPIGGMAPPTQAELVLQAVRESAGPDDLRTRLAEQAARRLSR